MQLICPSAFSFFQLLLYDGKEGSVGDFHLPIRLRMAWGGVEVPDSQLLAPFPKRLTVQLPFIISDEGMLNAESGDNRLP
jgi:hypothetical protein